MADLGSSLASAASWLCGHWQLYSVPKPHSPMSTGTGSKTQRAATRTQVGSVRVLWVPQTQDRGLLLLFLVTTSAS